MHGRGYQLRAKVVGARARERARAAQVIVSLPEPTRRALSAGALSGRRFDIAILAEALGLSSSELLDRLSRAVDAGLLAFSGQTRLQACFVMQGVREALLEGLSLSEAARVHLALAGALERRAPGPENIARIAEHYRAAPPTGSRRRALDYTAAAAAVAREDGDHARASALYEGALEIVDAGGADASCAARLWIEWGHALVAAEDPGRARDCFNRAFELARNTEDAEAIAAAAVGLRPFASLANLPDVETVARIEEALALVGPDEPAARALLLSRVSRAPASRVDADRRREGLEELEALEPRLQASDARLEALVARACALGHPGRADEMFSACDAILAHAPSSSSPSLWRLEGHALRALTFLQGADPRYASEWRDVGRLASRLREPLYRWHHRRLDTQHDMLDMPLVEALATVASMRREAPRVHGPWQRIIHRGQLHWILSERGHYDRLRDLDVDALVREFGWVGLSARAAFAALDAALGRTDRARRALAALTRDDLERIPKGSEYLDVLAYASEAAVALRDAPVACALLAALRPHASCLVVTGLGLLRGSVAHHAGVLSAFLGDDEQAVCLFELAMKIEAAWSITPRLVRSRMGWARLVQSTDPGAAAEMCALAAREAAIVDMHPELLR